MSSNTLERWPSLSTSQIPLQAFHDLRVHIEVQQMFRTKVPLHKCNKVQYTKFAMTMKILSTKYLNTTVEQVSFANK